VAVGASSSGVSGIVFVATATSPAAGASACSLHGGCLGCAAGRYAAAPAAPLVGNAAAACTACGAGKYSESGTGLVLSQ
jgi:hypothetical protein